MYEKPSGPAVKKSATPGAAERTGKTAGGAATVPGPSGGGALG